MILQRVDEIGIAKKRELSEKLKALIAKEMGGVCACRDTQEVPKIRIGRLLLQGARLIWPPEIQRWKCRSCGRTFSVKTESAISASKLFATTGATYAKGTLAGMTLKELASVCHVSLKDLVGPMRIRPFEVMQAPLQSPRSAHAVCCQAGRLYLGESLAGNRERSAVQMP